MAGTTTAEITETAIMVKTMEEITGATTTVGATTEGTTTITTTAAGTIRNRTYYKEANLILPQQVFMSLNSLSMPAGILFTFPLRSRR